MSALEVVKTSARLPDLSRVPVVDEVGINERVARFTSRSIKKASKVEALKLILSMIDLTTLEGQDTPGKVRQLCQKAMHLHDALPDLPHVAAGHPVDLERDVPSHNDRGGDRLHPAAACNRRSHGCHAVCQFGFGILPPASTKRP